jgi:hypothetical protein
MRSSRSPSRQVDTDVVLPVHQIQELDVARHRDTKILVRLQTSLDLHDRGGLTDEICREDAEMTCGGVAVEVTASPGAHVPAHC